jgi:NADH-quinone oxidoreductase subunit M
MPLLAGFLLFFGLAGMGLPGTSGFPAEFLLLAATLQAHAGAGLAALFVLVLGAAYFLDLYRRIFFGPVVRDAVARAQDLRPRELGLLLLLAAIILVFGLFPSLLLDFTTPTLARWAARFP